MTQITFRPIPVITGSADQDGVLLLVDEQLLGVLVRLSAPEHSVLRGSWFLEAGFGPCSGAASQTFATLDLAKSWARSRLI